MPWTKHRLGRAIAQAVSRWFPTAVARVYLFVYLRQTTTSVRKHTCAVI
jgi:hypothetical protein